MRRASMGRLRGGRFGAFGQALSLLAILCQLFAILLQPMPAAAAGANDGVPALVICHAGGDQSPIQQETPAHPSNCTLCPLCLAVALPALGATPPPLPSPPVISHAAALPQTRAGPALGAPRFAARARAPPASV